MMPRRIAITPVERGVEGGGNMGRRRMDVEGEGNDVAEEEKQDEEDEKEKGGPRRRKKNKMRRTRRSRKMTKWGQHHICDAVQ